jgi:hypothetical protein
MFIPCYIPSLFLNVHKKIHWRRWKISKESFKIGLTNRTMDFFVIIVLNVDHIFIHGISMLLIVTPKNPYQHPINYLYVPIYLWMECCRFVQLCVHILQKCNPKINEKYDILAHDNAPSYSKVHLELFKEHVCFFLSFDGYFTRYKNEHLSKLINYHK